MKKILLSLLFLCLSTFSIADELSEATFFSAIKSGDIPQVEKLLNQGINIHTQSDEGRYSLHYAVMRQDIPLAEFLLANGADVNTKDGFNHSPLYDAVIQGNFNMVQLLV